MPATITVTIPHTGPLFSAASGALFQRAREDIVQTLAEMAVERLTSAFPTGVPVQSGNYRRNIHATVNGAEAAVDDSGVIYGPWLEGTGSRNETTRFKGYSTFRRTGQWLEDQAQGVADKVGEKLVRELSEL